MKKKSPLKVVSLRKEGPKLDSNDGPFPPLFTPSYQPVPSTSSHAGSSTLNPMQDLLRQLNEIEL
jgi:hypothetical protein